MNEEALNVQDIGQLLSLVNLGDITCYQISGERLEGEDAEAAAEPAEAPLTEEADVPMQVLLRHTAQLIEVRVRVQAESPQARYVADFGARFDVQRPVQVSEDVLHQFIERVGVMAAYPFVREGLFSVAAKMRMPPPMLKLLQANRVTLTRDDAETVEA